MCLRMCVCVLPRWLWAGRGEQKEIVAGGLLAQLVPQSRETQHVILGCHSLTPALLPKSPFGGPRHTTTFTNQPSSYHIRPLHPHFLPARRSLFPPPSVTITPNNRSRAPSSSSRTAPHRGPLIGQHDVLQPPAYRILIQSCCFLRACLACPDPADDAQHCQLLWPAAG
jgi:hypothetical protein